MMKRSSKETRMNFLEHLVPFTIIPLFYPSTLLLPVHPTEPVLKKDPGKMGGGGRC